MFGEWVNIQSGRVTMVVPSAIFKPILLGHKPIARSYKSGGLSEKLS